MTRAVLALGSNLGEREATILEAVRRIAELDEVELTAVSRLHESVALTAHGVDADAPAYVNAVALVETTLSPVGLLEATHEIEAALGRVRGERWADRTIDIDLVDVGGAALNSENLTLPHPGAAEREFVLAPWLELDPDAHLAGERVADLLDRVRAR